MAFLGRQVAGEGGVGVREDGAQAVQEPVHLGAAAEEDAAQHQGGDVGGVGLGVGQRERGAPGAAEEQPAVDIQVGAQALDIVDQVLGGVGVQPA